MRTKYVYCIMTATSITNHVHMQYHVCQASATNQSQLVQNLKVYNWHECIARRTHTFTYDTYIQINVVRVWYCWDTLKRTCKLWAINLICTCVCIVFSHTEIVETRIRGSARSLSWFNNMRVTDQPTRHNSMMCGACVAMRIWYVYVGWSKNIATSMTSNVIFHLNWIDWF